METIKESCSCGAVFYVTSNSFVYAKEVYQEFLAAHETCRQKKQVITNNNKENQ